MSRVTTASADRSNTPATAGTFGLEPLEKRELLSTYYVATNGNDNNAGTLNSPLYTLEKAATKVTAGDTILLRGGTYYWTNDQWINAQGTSSNRITIDNYGSETVIIDGSNNTGNPTFGQNDNITIAGKYITIKDITVRNAKRDGIEMFGGAQHITLSNIKAHNNKAAGISVHGDPYNIWSTTRIRVEKSTIYRNAQANNPVKQNGGWPGAMISHFASYVDFIDNKVYENYGEGLLQVVSHGGFVQGNTLYDNYSHNIYLDNATSTTVRNNFVYTNNKAEFRRNGYPATGITVANENYVVNRDSKDNTIVNNVVTGGVHGFYYGNYDRGGGLKYTLVAHNVFHNSNFESVKIDFDNGHVGSNFVNNIFSTNKTTGHLARYDGGGSIGRSHNGISGGAGTTQNFSGGNYVYTPVKYLKSTGKTAGDYRLQSSSGMRNVGKSGVYSTDFWWTNRDSTPHLGAFEA